MSRPGRIARILLVVLAVAALATAGIVTNFVLLGYADPRSDPVGKLTPRADITQPAAPAPTRRAADDRRGDEAETEEPDD